MKKRYTYKLRPSAQAVDRLRSEHRKSKWVWNECVHQFRSGGKPTAAKLDRMLTESRGRFAWLREGSSVVQQQTIREYATALDASFKVKQRRRPRSKTRKRDPYASLNYTVRGFSITKDRRLKLAGGISIPVVWSRDLPSEPTSIRVYEDAAGWWWVSFVVEVPDSEPLPSNSSGIGIDWGVKTTAVTTQPKHDLDYQGHALKQAKGLAKYQRRMAHSYVKGASEQSPAYKKAKRDTAKLHRKVRWQRQEHSRKWAQAVVRDNGFIAVEDFKPKFLAKSTMARKVQDAALGALKRTLVQIATEAGRTVVLVNPAYTTMTCNRCGSRTKNRIPLDERVFRCEQVDCGHTDGRDHNAALNILYQAGFNLAPVEEVSPLILRDSRLSEGGIPRL